VALPSKTLGRDTRLENLCPNKNYVFVSFLTKTKFLKKHKFSSGKPSFSPLFPEKGQGRDTRLENWCPNKNVEKG
jgi:hypothetical protein